MRRHGIFAAWLAGFTAKPFSFMVDAFKKDRALVALGLARLWAQRWPPEGLWLSRLSRRFRCADGISSRPLRPLCVIGATAWAATSPILQPFCGHSRDSVRCVVESRGLWIERGPKRRTREADTQMAEDQIKVPATLKKTTIPLEQLDGQSSSTVTARFSLGSRRVRRARLGSPLMKMAWCDLQRIRGITG